MTINKKINLVFRKDIFLLLCALIIMWIVLFIIMYGVIALCDNNYLLTLVYIIWFIILFFGSTSIISVIIHLRKHKIRIYTEDFLHKGSNSNDS